MSKYVVYLTVYRGNKMPPFYIGSTSLEKHRAGYIGSVKSKMYKDVFLSEKIANPQRLLKSYVALKIDQVLFGILNLR